MTNSPATPTGRFLHRAMVKFPAKFLNRVTRGHLLLVITSEFETSKVVRARDNLAAGGVSDLVEIREGDALETLASGLPETIDLLLLDGAKSLYMDVLRLVESRLRKGAIIIADNADYCPEYLEYVSRPENGYLSMAFTDEVELTVKLG